MGGKGANLCEMARIGLNVPAGLTITTEVCQQFYKAGNESHLIITLIEKNKQNPSGGKLPDGCWEEILAGLKTIEESRGAIFGDTKNPLLISARSGAAVIFLLLLFNYHY